MSTSDLNAKLEKSRKELLDLSTRNRLIHTSRSNTRSTRLDIVGESSDHVFKRLVVDGKSMTFLPRPDSEAEDDSESGLFDEVVLSQPNEEPNGTSANATDDRLQSRLDSDKLQKRLLKLFYDARTNEEEQGVNILFLTLGFLKWYEDAKSETPRYAPLILVPVKLSRQSAMSRFKVAYNEDELATNLSLQARLKDDFSIELPELPETESLCPSDYYAEVAKAIAGQDRWEVLANDMVLWFYSFSKFLMYRDLQPGNWPEGRSLGNHPIIRGILQEPFTPEPPLCGDDDFVDSVISPHDAVHVVPADSSQSIAIEEVKQGRNLVIQGPPGTGKSQTIANLIAAAVHSGKSVLFVAEKMAALDVVHRRLANIGLGDMCLELHSNKANKKVVLQDIQTALSLQKPIVGDVQRHCDELTRCRNRLNRHLEIIHTPISPSGFTPFQMVGQLVRLRACKTRPPEFQLKEPHTWTRSALDQRLNLLRDLADHVAEIGQPDQHPWRGSQLDVVLPMDVDRLLPKVTEACERATRLLQAGQELAGLLNLSPPRTAQELARMAHMAQHLARSPELDAPAMGSPAWRTQRGQIDGLIETGQSYADCQRELKDVVVDAGWSTELVPTRRDLAAYGRSLFRIFRRAYRDAQANLRGILVDQPPKDLDDRLRIVDTLIKGQKTLAVLNSSDAQTLGRECFGHVWNGPDSQWERLKSICDWEASCREAKLPSDFREVLSQIVSKDALVPVLKRIGEDWKPFRAIVNEIGTVLKLDFQIAFGTSEPIAVPLEDYVSRFEQWEASTETLSHWVAYSTRKRRLEEVGMEQLVDELHTGITKASEAVDRCEMAFFETLLRQVFEANPELASFNGGSHEKLLTTFRQLDRERIDLARREVASAHYDGIPNANSAMGEMGVIQHEIQKKRRHLPIRQLLGQAGRAIQRIKPVFMMSPISVAQYLEPGATDFDLLLIDEASQVEPVDALGAIARAKQVVVVGDSRQLPPTSFFSRSISGDGEEGDEMQAGDSESILGLCCSRNIPQRMLRWHYRSNHHSLIAVSNREFYENRLYVIPSPRDPSEYQGLVFEYIQNGVFDRGGTATNRIEARAVAQAVMNHARNHPNLTLGVGTFSVSQRDAVLDELELLRRQDSSLESFFSSNSDEPFFVKNLENIQGDERAVIFISVGYAKDSMGHMSMSFGPLSNDGGERRLNVLISRARECCKVFSSIKADDIDLNRAKGRGPSAFKNFLRYAELGIIDADTGHGTEHDSEFERQVAVALRQHGLETRPQVGVAGFFIDLAVVDPECPGRYLLGIECDGANYHNSRSARDRDQIRQAVLEDRGWIIHRIWSTDWFHRPEEELRKLLAAVEQAKVSYAAKGRGPSPPSPSVASEPMQIDRVEELATSGSSNGLTSSPYQVASFSVPALSDIHQLPPYDLARIICKIIRMEAPVHRDEVLRRVTGLWGLARAGKRIREAVEVAFPLAESEADIVADGDFYLTTQRNDIPIRDRGAVDSNSLRKPEMLPPVEIRKAIAAIVEVHHGVSTDEVVKEVARLVGFKSTSAQLREVIERQLTTLIDTGLLENRNDRLYLRQNAGIPQA